MRRYLREEPVVDARTAWLETRIAELERDPYHPGANHHYIHAVEASPTPERAEGAADRLTELDDIRIGHTIHMPSHIYARIGRWHDASSANQRAIVADHAYLEAYEAEGLVPLLHHPHNVHFLSWTAGVEGRRALALEAAEDVVAATPAELAADLPFLNGFLVTPLLGMVRFEMWDEVLSASRRDDPHQFVTATRHCARGRAYAGLGRPDEAANEAAALQTIASSEAASDWEMPEAFFPGRTLLGIMQDVLSADLAVVGGDLDEAAELLERAVAAQDGLPYMEPPYWSVSARLDLGRVLLAAGRYQEAAQVYQADLEVYPSNGWALFGLAQALEASGDDVAAEEVWGQFEEVWGQFEEVWRHADVDRQVDDGGIAVAGSPND